MCDPTGNTPRTERPVQVTCDEEAWVLSRLQILVETVIAVRRVKPDSNICDRAITGAIHGTAIELLRVLDLEPEYSNIKKGE